MNINTFTNYGSYFMNKTERNAFVCICSTEYLPFYKILFNSLKIHSPNTKQILYHIGEVAESFDEKVDITPWYNAAVYPETLNKICSLRARVVLDAFSRGYKNVVFLGAKVEFFSNPHLLFNVLDSQYDAFGTPHILSPLPEDGLSPSNSSVSFTGHLSTDLVGFCNSPASIKFLQWQDEIMKTKCRTTGQTYLDQSWLNFLPCFVPNVYIDRTMGLNHAYWRLHESEIIKENEQWKVKHGNHLSDLVAFQFSGLDINSPIGISKYQNRWMATGDFLLFLQNYCDKMKNV